MLTQIVFLMIVSRYEEIVWDFLLIEGDMGTFGDGENGSYFMFLIKEDVLLRRLRFLAAWMVEM